MLAGNNRGFTLIESLFCLTLLSVLLTLSLPLLKFIDSPAYSADLSAHQFFTFIEGEINQSLKVISLNNELSITDPDERLITISKYNDGVRRQVDQTGHELLITNIQNLTFTQKNHLLTVSLVLKDGTTYEKVLYLPPQ
ncbi:competence type IV pilus minor pilin ComGF [Halobacillus naozhouensis]|uniref:Competence type IV pilus minor pilin ComGF n=1 Tax=Halobacillus naozhouensis TaxID=554880 RepID=A0ABY8IVB6_9BACI|nr:competence type IV pilus minor pilin ComGF [Halobacillus naozhouensis]WFT73249.1 competence type IV pilus minor pilin ComGF [Halobacillus naozhouensis]